MEAWRTLRPWKSNKLAGKEKSAATPAGNYKFTLGEVRRKCALPPAGTGSQQPTSNEGAGGLLGGLGGLLDKLQKGGLSNVANSWVGSGQNQPVSPGQLGSALGTDIIKTLSQRSGIPEDELTRQLSQVLPGVVDKLTPNGRVPTVAELSQML